MSQTNDNSPNVGNLPDRRREGRVHVTSGHRSTTYAELGGGQFGIITDISEGGLGMQTVGPLTADDFSSLSFRLSPFGNQIRPSTQVAWKSASNKAVGVRFLALSPAERMELKGWVFTHLPLEGSLAGINSSPALEKPVQPLSDPFGHLQQLLTENTRRQINWRKSIQWGLAAVLGIFVLSCFIALWRLAPRTSFRNLSAFSGRSVAAVRSILEQTRGWARGAFHIGNSEDNSSTIVTVPLPPKPKTTRSTLSSRGEGSIDIAAARLREPVDTPKPTSAGDESAPGPVGCRNLIDSDLSGQNRGGNADTASDATFLTPVLTIGPAYPIMEAQSCVDGAVRLRATIDRNGIVRRLQPVSGPPSLYESAMTAARYWRFRPIVSQGQAIEAERDIQVVFRNMLEDTK